MQLLKRRFQKDPIRKNSHTWQYQVNYPIVIANTSLFVGDVDIVDVIYLVGKLTFSSNISYFIDNFKYLKSS